MINPGSVQIYGPCLVLIVIVMIELWLLVALKWFVDYAHFCYIKKCCKIVGHEDRRCDYVCDDQSLLRCFFYWPSQMSVCKHCLRAQCDLFFGFPGD